MTIKQKQWQLSYLGYYGGAIDGIWGAQSKAAATRFQKDYELDADGVFGAMTIAKTVEIIKAIQKEITDGKNRYRRSCRTRNEGCHHAMAKRKRIDSGWHCRCQDPRKNSDSAHTGA